MLDDLSHPDLVNFARRFVSEDEAEDVVQTAYVKMLGTRAHFSGRSRKQTWACAVVKRCALDLIRSRGSRPTVPLSDALADTLQIDPAAVADRLDAETVFRQLTADEQQLLLAARETKRDLAKQMGVSPTTVNARRQALRKKLQSLL